MCVPIGTGSGVGPRASRVPPSGPFATGAAYRIYRGLLVCHQGPRRRRSLLGHPVPVAGVRPSSRLAHPAKPRRGPEGFPRSARVRRVVICSRRAETAARQ
jgi:hypothetical protein